MLNLCPPDFNLVRVQMLNLRETEDWGPGTRRPGADRDGEGERLPGCSRPREEEPKCAERDQVCRLLRPPPRPVAVRRLGILQDGSPHPHGTLPAEDTPSPGSDLPTTGPLSQRPAHCSLFNTMLDTPGLLRGPCTGVCVCGGGGGVYLLNKEQFYK